MKTYFSDRHLKSAINYILKGPANPGPGASNTPFRTVFPAHFNEEGTGIKVEVTKALAALQPLYGKDNIEVITTDGHRIRGVVRSLKMTQALTKPSVKVERPDGEVVKVAFADIAEVIDHNAATDAALIEQQMKAKG
jgi:hypothetical protein